MGRHLIRTCSCEDFPCCIHADAYTDEDAWKAYEEFLLSSDDYKQTMRPTRKTTRYNDRYDGSMGIFTDYENETPLGRELGDGTEIDS